MNRISGTDVLNRGYTNEIYMLSSPYKEQLTMQVKVTQEGLFIPREWLHGFDEFEIRREGHLILIMPITPPALTFKQPAPPIDVAEDPIWHLGEDPVDDELEDASINHDKYLYRL